MLVYNRCLLSWQRAVVCYVCKIGLLCWQIVLIMSMGRMNGEQFAHTQAWRGAAPAAASRVAAVTLGLAVAEGSSADG